MKRPHIQFALLPGVLFALFALFPSATHAADQYVSGAITADTTWYSATTYIVTGNVTVNSNVRLTVEPGTTIKFDSGKYLTIASNAVLSARGESGNNIIFTANSASPTPGYWQSIKFNASASGTISYALVAYGNYAIDNGGGMLTVEHAEVANNYAYGVYHTSGTSTIASSSLHDTPTGIFAVGTGSVTIASNTFEDHSDFPVYLLPTGSFSFANSGNTSSGTGKHGIYLEGTFQNNQVLAADGMPYVIYGDVAVAVGKTFSVQSGAVVKFNTNKRISVSGILDAQGTADAPIYFTSYKDDVVGGDTNGDGTSSGPAKGDWDSLLINASATGTIAHAVIRYGGSYWGTNLYNNGGTMTFEDSESATSNEYGVRQDSGTGLIQNTDIHNQSVGVAAYGGTLTVSGNAIHRHTGYGLYYAAGTLTLTDNIFQNNTVHVYPAGSCGTNGNICGPAAILKSGTLANSETWTASTVPYIIAPWLTVPSGKTLTIEEGAVVKFMGATSSLYVVGTLATQGTSGNEVIFTSIKDDDADGNDTNNDGASTGSAGDWQTIFVYPNATADLTHTKMRYGGSYKDNYFVSLYNYGGSVDLDNVEIATSTVWGLFQASGDATIVFSDFHTASASIGITGGTMSVSSTEIYNNDTEGIKQMGGMLDITASHIHHNDIYGVYVQGGRSDITSSVFNDNNYGLMITGGTSGHSFHENGLYDNSLYGVYNDTANTLSATSNWWGAWTSPGTCDPKNPNDCSDATSTDVSATPWHHNWGVWAARNYGVNDYELRWHGTTKYTDQLDAAIFTWNSVTSGAGIITVSSVTATSSARLLMRDENTGPNNAAATTTIYSTASSSYDYIQINIDRLDYYDTLYGANAPKYRQMVYTHELGHSLGLGHSDPETGNVMISYETDQIDLGDEDKSDYALFWATLSWVLPWWWL